MVLAVNELLEHSNCTLTNTPYTWYTSNIIVLTWSIIHGKEHPLDLWVMSELDGEKFGEFPRKLEGIIGWPVMEEYACLMAGLFDLIDRFAGISEKMDPVHVGAVTFSLTPVML